MNGAHSEGGQIAFLEAVVNSNRDGILVLDREGHIVVANPAIEGLSGVSHRALLGRTIEQVVAEMGPQVLAALGYREGDLQRIASMLQSASREVVQRTLEATGPPRRFIEETSAPVLGQEDRVIGRMIVFHDVTVEQEVVHARRDFTDMVVHDLRTPLTSMLGGLDLARVVLAQSGDLETVNQALDAAVESCQRIATLVDSLLDISRLESGQMPMECRSNALPSLVAQVVEHVYAIAASAEVSLDVRLPATLPLVMVDRQIILRVFLNLIDNAIKFSPSGERVVISARRADPDVVECAIHDSGSGVPPEYREIIFERFTQLRTHISRRMRGSGLGLSYCKLAVEAHGGRIWCEGPPEGGSVFWFTLPIAKGMDAS